MHKLALHLARTEAGGVGHIGGDHVLVELAGGIFHDEVHGLHLVGSIFALLAALHHAELAVHHPEGSPIAPIAGDVAFALAAVVHRDTHV